MMDMSKFPRFSKTNQPDPNPQDPDTPASERLDDSYATVSPGPEAWISIAIGLLVLLMQRTFINYLLGRETPTVTDIDRGTITYAESFFFIEDLGLFVFGLALVLDGVLLLINRPNAVLVGLIITLLAAALNLYTLLRLYSPLGFRLFPAIAFILAIYTAIYQWKLLRITRAHRPAPMT
jgi:hypothetical protein